MKPPTDLMQLMQQLALRQEAYVVVTVVRAQAPTSAYVGAQAVVSSDGSLHGWIGGGCTRRIVVEAALDAIGRGSPRLLRISNSADRAADQIETHGMPCASNGEIELFIHPFGTAPSILVLGRTPVAAAARQFAQAAGFRVIEQGEDTEALVPQLALVATMGEGDLAALERALCGSARCVLLVASARKAHKLRHLLSLRGLSQHQLARLESPAGPDIGARTPPEIALAAIAGAVAWWRSARGDAAAAAVAVDMVGKAGSASGATGTAREPAAAVLAAPPPAPSELIPRPAPAKPALSDGADRYVNPVCGMAVDPARAIHAVVYEGARFYFCCDGCKDEFERSPARYAEIQVSLQRGARAEVTP